MQDASEKYPYTKLVGEPVRVELKSTFLPEHVTQLIV